MAKTIGSGDKTDFDETRRLLYMADRVLATKRYNLVGTLTNALLHHHAVDDLDAREVMAHVTAVVEGGDGEAAGRAFLWEQIDRITQELGD